MADPGAHPGFWQPVVDTAAAAARGDPGSRDSIGGLLDDLRGTGWASLADALARLLADRGTFVAADGLPPDEQVIVQRVREALDPAIRPAARADG